MGRAWFTEHEHISSEFKNLTVYDPIVAAITIKPNGFDKSYGIDWCEMNDELTEIVKFQEKNVSDISHILDEPTAQFKKGIINTDRQKILYELYETEKYRDQQIPTTWINLAEGEKAILDLTVYIRKHLEDDTSKRELNLDSEDYIKFVVQDPTLFNIKYKRKQNAAIELKKLHNDSIKVFEKIEITALKTFNTKQYILLETNDGLEVGRIEMAANNTSNLDIKIIPVVIKDTSAAKELATAQQIYDDALNAGKLLETLNKKSLNQAGVICTNTSIRPTTANNVIPKVDDTEYIVIDVNDLSAKWKKFYQDGMLRDWLYQGDSDKSIPKPAVRINEDNEESYGIRDYNPRFLIDKLEDTYYAKYGKTHKGTLFFVSDQNYLDPGFQKETLAVQLTCNFKDGLSQTIPLRSQGICIFKKGIQKADVYAHELGHLLGLEHSFLLNEADFNSTNDQLNFYTNNHNNKKHGEPIKSVADKKEDYKNNIKDYNEELLKLNKELSELEGKANPTEKESNRIIEINNIDKPQAQKSLAKNKDRLIKIDVYTTVANFKVTKGASLNYMDYMGFTDNTKTKLKERTYYHKYQATTIKKEVDDFYS